MRELELKLEVDEPFVTPPLAAEEGPVGGIEELAPLDLRATYCDTADLRLARHGLTLRHRTGEADHPAWSLKLPLDEDAATREELHFDGSERRVPEEVLDLVTAFARGAAVAPVARLRTKRRRWSLRDAHGGEVAELVDDRVSVLRGGRVADRFRELEIESRTMNRAGIEGIARVLQRAGASEPKTVPKVMRALGPKAFEPPDFVVRDSLSPDDPAAYAVQTALGRGLRRILVNDAGARLGDEEAVHQMRVGARRLRSDLRTFKPLLAAGAADTVRELRGELRWLGDALGGVRDLDVIGARLRERAEGLDADLEPLFSLIEARHAERREALMDVLRSDRYVALLNSLVLANHSPPLDVSAWEPARVALPSLVAKPLRKLRRGGRALGPDDDAKDYHQVRIRAKRARYGAEAVAPALGRKRGRAAARLAKRAAKLQDLLGELQDSVVARELLSEVRALHAQDRSLGFGLGRLYEREEQADRDARAAFPRRWKKLDRKKARRWLTS